MMTAVLLTCALWIGQATAPAGMIRGQVVDARTAAPIVDARVTVVEAGRDVITSADGRFVFDSVTPGRYTLTVSRIGYAFVRRRIQIATDAGVELVVPLAEGTDTYQERITVTASTAANPASGGVRTLGSAALQELRGIAADDPMRAVQALPGVATGDDFRAEFSVRGSAFRHIGIVIDGTPAPVLLHAVRGADDTGSVAMINTDILSRATLAAGPQPLRHGDWIGATLEFDVREGSRDRVITRGAVSGTNASVVVEGPLGSRRGSFLISTRKSYLDWLVRKVAPEIDSTIGFADGHLKIAYDLTPRQQAQLLVIGGRAGYREDSTSPANGLLRAGSASLLASALWRYAAPRLVVSQRVSHVGNDFRNVGLAGQMLARGYVQGVITRIDVLVPLPRGWSIEGGGRVDRERMNEVLREYRIDASRDLAIRAEREVSNARTTTAGWAQLGRHSAAGAISAGARVTAQTGVDAALLPWVLAERRIGTVTIHAGANRSLQFADPAMVVPDGTSDPERATAIDAGVEHRLTREMRWSATVFRREEARGRRRIGEPRLHPITGQRLAQALFPTYAGVLDGRTHGVDLLLGRTAASGLRGWIGYTYARTQYTDTRSGERFDGDFDQRHTINAFAEYRLSYRAAVSAKLRVGSNMPVVGYFEQRGPDALRLSANRNTVRLPTYARLDLRATRTFTSDRRRVTLFLELMNVLGRRNVRQTEANIRPNFDVTGLAERLIPFVPSAGMLVEF
jgi:hypothetical protein